MPKDEKLYQDMRKEFRNRYFNKIAPKLKQYDFERKKRKKAAILCLIFFIFIAIICLYATKQSGNSFLFNIAVISLILAFWIPSVIKKFFEIKIKTKIMPLVCECFGENFQWKSDEIKYVDNEIIHDDYKINYTDYKTSNLVSYFNHLNTDDIFIGEYKDIPIEIVECSLEYKGNKSTTTVFKGVIEK